MKQMATVIITHSVAVDDVIGDWTEEEQERFHDGHREAIDEFESQALEIIRSDGPNAVCDDVEVILP